MLKKRLPIRAAVREATEQVRDVMADLRPPVLDDYGLVAALHWQVERFAARTGISAEVAGDDLTPRPEIAVELVLFRAVQEALTNVAKHARARRASVSVRQEGGTVRIEVVDDGVNALIFPSGDAEALAERLGRILGDPVLSERLRSGARTSVAGLDTASAAEKLAGLFRAHVR